jgi:tetratricopeptide (TPR) repeat protein
MRKIGSLHVILILAFSAIVCIAFIYGYPRLFAAIEASGHQHYQENVARALSEGNLAKAIKIARRAQAGKSERPGNQVEPMARVVLSRLLITAGKADEALNEIDAALKTPNDQVAPFRETREYYYFAPARLTLGGYYAEQGDSARAIANFELARGDAAPPDAVFDDFCPLMYETYASNHLWVRALEWTQPEAINTDAFDQDDALLVARAAVFRKQWDLARRASDRLPRIGASQPEAYYLLGRVLLEQGQPESALTEFEQAAAAGQPFAAFFQGTALEKLGRGAEAARAFLNVPEGDLYRTFALAKAHDLLSTLPPDQISGMKSPQEILDMLSAEIAALHEMQRPAVYDRYQRMIPLAFKTSAAAGPSTLLILWKDNGFTSGEPYLPQVLDAPDQLLLTLGENVVQIQCVENLIPWECVERLQEHGDSVPGWIDTAREWYELRNEPAARIQKDEQGNSLIAIDRLTWLYSVPVRVSDDASYLLAGRVKAPRGQAGLAWQAFDSGERVAFEDHLRASESSDVWMWQSAYVHSQLFWDTLRVQLEAVPDAGPAEFDDVLLARIRMPARQ